jgi:hypothetical protein
MSGLTSSYILAKLAAAGTTAATKAIILEFLNKVPDAAATLKAKKGQMTTLVERLPERETTGWHKLIAPDGELKREDGAIACVSPSAGEKKIERYLVV